MTIFKVYKHPTEGCDAVKAGFSWPACCFGVIWMILKKLWGRAALWFGMYIGIAFVEAAAEQSQENTARAIAYLILAAAYLALWLAPGFKGNQWRETDLLQRGYTLQDTVHAHSPEAAIGQANQSSEVR